MNTATIRIALTPGEPAGIGPDICLQQALSDHPAELVAFADIDLLRERAQQLKLDISLQEHHLQTAPQAHRAGHLWVHPVPLRAPVQTGVLNPANADYVLDTLQQACQACVQHNCHALVTAPVHKGVINQAGIAFSGHTEFFAERTDTPLVVMMLATHSLRVALVTTHLPLADIPKAITAERVEQVIRILHRDLCQHFGLAQPRILVCGLNPHAGEDGHLGHEEIDIIQPVLDTLRREGLHLRGPVPADTAFTSASLAQADVVLSMYHDQGLPVLKHQGFGEAVNVTLGLPIIRTSVDHGTALALAGTGQAHVNSLVEALNMAHTMALAKARASHHLHLKDDLIFN